MTPEQNKEIVMRNDQSIQRQVPGILLDTLRVQNPNSKVANRPEELFWRAIGRG